MTGSISSMTGFARREGASANLQWAWEVRSVNNRGLEMRFRLPTGLDILEVRLRKAVQSAVKRGSVNASLSIKADESAASIQVNETALDAIVDMIALVEKKTKCAPSQATGLLALRGVIEQSDNELGSRDSKEIGAFHEALHSGFEEALSSLIEARQSEGEKMLAFINDQLDQVEALVKKAGGLAVAAPEKLRERVKAQLDELLAGASLPEERLAQEAALLAVKADIREELDRLAAHIEAARALLSGGGAIGRKFDFLTQEFNREANTLCSKAPDIALKQIGLDLKNVIDQMREQIQNIE